MSTTIITKPSARSFFLKDWLKHYPLRAYFSIAFIGTWLTYAPLLLGRDGLGLLPYKIGDAGLLLVMLSAFTGPFLAAYLVTAATSGKAGTKQLRRRYFQWRVGFWWYLPALFGNLLIWLVGLSFFYGPTLFNSFFEQSSLLLSVYLPFLLTLGLVGALGEETGWRGFALPRLQAKYGPLLGTLILATLHGLWHIPLLLVTGPVAGLLFQFPLLQAIY